MRIVLNTGRDRNEIETALNENNKLDFAAESVDYILKGIESAKLNTLIHDELELHLTRLPTTGCH